MPRYFFNVSDGHSVPDREGTELPDLASARAEAIKLSGEVLRDMGARFWDATQWKLTVCDESGRALFVLRFSADEPEASPDAG